MSRYRYKERENKVDIQSFTSIQGFCGAHTMTYVYTFIGEEEEIRKQTNKEIN